MGSVAELKSHNTRRLFLTWPRLAEGMRATGVIFIPRPLVMTG